MKHRKFLAAITATAALVAAGCGGDDDAADNTSAPAATAAPAPDTEAPAETAAPDTEAPDTEAPGTDAPAPGSTAAGTTDEGSTAPTEPITIKVGVAAPLSGAYVSLGESAVAGVELAVEHLAERGVTVELVTEDTASDPQTTLNVFTKLAEQDQVHAILGTLCSACNVAATQALEAAQIPQLTIGEGSASGCEASSLVVCVVEDSGSRVDTIIAMAEAQGAKSVGVLQSELSAPGKEVTEALQAALPEVGIEVSVAVAAADAQDFKAQLTTIRDADLIVVAGAAGSQSGIVLRNMQDLGMEQQVLGLIWSDEILTAADEQFVLDHYKFTAAFVAAAPEAADFTPAFEAANDGRSPDKYAATAYTSMMLLAEGALAAGVDDGVALREAIEPVAIETPLGTSAIVDGVWAIPARLAQIQDGQQVFVD